MRGTRRESFGIYAVDFSKKACARADGVLRKGRRWARNPKMRIHCGSVLRIPHCSVILSHKIPFIDGNNDGTVIVARIAGNPFVLFGDSPPARPAEHGDCRERSKAESALKTEYFFRIL